MDSRTKSGTIRIKFPFYYVEINENGEFNQCPKLLSMQRFFFLLIDVKILSEIIVVVGVIGTSGELTISLLFIYFVVGKNPLR